MQGSVEALTESLERLSTDEVKLKVIHGSVGAVNESDVMLASASNAIVLGFNVKADAKAASQAQSDGVDVRSYSVIYDVINDVKAALSGMLAPEIRETILGRAQVRQLFPHLEARPHLRLRGHRGQDGARRARAREAGRDACSARARSRRSSASRTTSARCCRASSAASGSTASRASRPNDTIEAFTTEEVARTL